LGIEVTRYLLDTDTFTLYLRHDLFVFSNFLKHHSDGLGLPVIVIEEIWDGWQSVIRKAKAPEDASHAYQRLTNTILELQNWQVLTFTIEAMKIYQELKKAKLNIGSNDLKIAACTLASGSILVTRNTQDYTRIPGLQIVDWSRSAQG
jgi:tRNA(fMet)-specific endonuclease VapC